MYLLDTDNIKKSHISYGYDENKAEEVAREWAVYEGVEIPIFDSEGYGILPGSKGKIKIPQAWCRLEIKR